MLYQETLYGIWPVLQAKSLILDLESNPNDAETYVFATALCAATSNYLECSITHARAKVPGGEGDYLLAPSYPEEAKPVYAGAHCYRAVIPMDEAYEIMGEKTDVAKIYFGPNRGAVSYRITGGDVCPEYYQQRQ